MALCPLYKSRTLLVFELHEPSRFSFLLVSICVISHFSFSVFCLPPLASLIFHSFIPRQSSLYSPTAIQPLERSYFTFVTDIQVGVAAPFFSPILHGWLNRSVASDPYGWHPFTLTTPSDQHFPHLNTCVAWHTADRVFSGSVYGGTHHVIYTLRFAFCFSVQQATD